VSKTTNVYPVNQYRVTIREQDRYDIKSISRSAKSGVLYEMRERKKKNFCVVGDLDPGQQYNDGVRLVTGVVRTEDGTTLSLFQWAALLDGLVFFDQRSRCKKV